MVAPSPPTLALVTDSGLDGDFLTNTAAITATVVLGTTPTFAIATENPADLVWLAIDEVNALLAGLGDGDVTILGRQTNSLGEVSRVASLTFTIDKTPPTAPSVSPTNVGADLVVDIEPGGAAHYSYRLVGETEFSSPSPTAPTGLPAGTYEILVVTIDAAGNTSDETIVQVTVILPPGVTLNDTGVSDTDTITNIGLLDVVLDEGNTAEFSYDGGATWQTEQSTDLADGTYSVLVRQVNEAGIASESVAITFTLDTVVADLVLPSTLDVDAWLDIVDSPQIERFEEGALLEFSIDDGATGTTDAPSTDLTDGTTILLKQTDLAGNESNPTTVTIDVAPEPPAERISELVIDWASAPASGLF